MTCCGKKVTDEYAGTFKMRFVGWDREGKLLRGAPGNYKNGDIVSLRWHNSKHAWWEIAEKIPTKATLQVPPGESVYEPDSNFVEFIDVEEDEEEPHPLDEEEDEPTIKYANIGPQISSGSLTKRELISYIESAGGEGKMSMSKEELQGLALSLGYPS